MLPICAAHALPGRGGVQEAPGSWEGFKTAAPPPFGSLFAWRLVWVVFSQAGFLKHAPILGHG